MDAGKKERGRGTVILLGLLVLGSVLVFVLGVMVGSNVRIPAEAMHVAQAPGVNPAMPGRVEVPLPKKGQPAPIKGEGMTFYDTLTTGSKNDVPGQGPATATQPIATAKQGSALPGALTGQAPPPPPAQPAVAPTESAASPGAAPAQPAPTAGGSAPPITPAQAERAAEKGSPPAASKGATEHFYYIQVAAIKDAQEARARVDKLSALGFSAYMDQVKTDRGLFFRIRVGKVPSRDEAARILADLKSKTAEGKDAFLSNK